MLNRWLGITTAALMIVANTAVFLRDVVPGWMAGDPPKSAAAGLLPGERLLTQVGIFDSSGGNLGRSWTEARHTTIGQIRSIETNTLLEPIGLASGLVTPRVRITTRITYRENRNVVDDLDFRIHGLHIPIFLKAETMPSGEFPFQWQVGDEEGRIVLDSTAPAALGDCIRPFDRLPDLYVGRAWQLELLDPLAQILPNVNAGGLGFETILIKVTSKEMVEIRGKKVEAYIVEGGGAKAWVEPDTGRVLRQEVTVPILGRLILLDEPYDAGALQRAMDSIPSESEPPPQQEFMAE